MLLLSIIQIELFFESFQIILSSIKVKFNPSLPGGRWSKCCQVYILFYNFLITHPNFIKFEFHDFSWKFFFFQNVTSFGATVHSDYFLFFVFVIVFVGLFVDVRF